MKIVISESQLKNIIQRESILIQESALQRATMMVNQEIMDLGEPELSMEDVNDLAGCEMDDTEVPNEHKGLFQKIKAAINVADNKQLKNTFRQIKSIIKGKKPVSEQAEVLMILGVPATTAALMFIGGLLLLSILAKLIRNILSTDREYVPSCRQGMRAVKERRGY